jgi:hypothetical protein
MEAGQAPAISYLGSASELDVCLFGLSENAGRAGVGHGEVGRTEQGQAAGREEREG